MAGIYIQKVHNKYTRPYIPAEFRHDLIHLTPYRPISYEGKKGVGRESKERECVCVCVCVCVCGGGGGGGVHSPEIKPATSYMVRQLQLVCKQSLHGSLQSIRAWES